jgi:oxygen-independent coproporphyrinogen-3 oxidase
VQLTHIKARPGESAYVACMSSVPYIDAELLRRYDQLGPRYTSYPTSPQFREDFGATELRQAIQRSNDDPIPRRLSLYLHVPFCMSPCFYCGCNRIITRDAARGEVYLTRLYREIELTSTLFDRDREVIQLHFGGGTPNFLAPTQLAEAVDVLRGHFRFGTADNSDLSIELDPRFLKPGDVRELAAAGFNRASLGVQDFDPAVQEAVNRIQGVAETLAIIDACRTHGMRSVNVDLIYGLPKQSLRGFARTLDIVIGARPDRLAVYGYAHLPAMFKAQRQLAAEDLPPPALKLELLCLAIAKLTDAGYIHIGMDHFALPDDELALAQRRGSLHRNFMGYTTHADTDLIGMGVSAISHVGDSFSQNPRDLAGWQVALDEGRLPVFRGMRLSEDDVLRADLIQQLMCQGEISISTLERRHAIEFNAYFADELVRLEPLERDGLLRFEPGRIVATRQGGLLLRNIAMCFDHYLQSPMTTADAVTTGGPLFSQAV